MPPPPRPSQLQWLGRRPEPSSLELKHASPTSTDQAAGSTVPAAPEALKLPSQEQFCALRRRLSLGPLHMGRRASENRALLSTVEFPSNKSYAVAGPLHVALLL